MFPGDRCAMCLKPGKIHYHHLVPRREGGTDDEENLIPLCPRCHKFAELGKIPREVLTRRNQEIISLRELLWEEGGPTYFVVWKRECWKCGKVINVIYNATGWSVFPYPCSEGEMWMSSLPKTVVKAAKKLGATLEFRRTNAVPEGYLVNTCPKCKAVQGDWYLQEEFIEVTYGLKKSMIILMEVIGDKIIAREFYNGREISIFYEKR